MPLLFFLCIPANADPLRSAPFSYSELTALYHRDELDGPLRAKLDAVLSTPFVRNSNSGRVNLPRSKELGEYLRVFHWNIQRGIEFNAIRALLTSDAELKELLNHERFKPGSEALAKLLDEAAMLRAADVIVLNEVDVGMKRTGYRNIAADLADALGMNYAFGVQFVELSPVYLTEKTRGNAAGVEVADILSVDPAHYKGLHGVAILSRFPLENVRLIPFKTMPYDWFKSEKKGPSVLEKGKRAIAKTVFLEETFREVRRGGRTTLLAEIADERLPMGRITIAATHLENRTKPARRVDQMNELLDKVRDIPHPVVLAGDLNTSTSDLTPTSVRREFMNRFGNPKYWVRQAASYALGIGMLEEIILSGITFGRKHSDPTVKHIPFIAPNPERQLFKKIKEFRFADGVAFDLRGDKTRSAGGKTKAFSNSNQRGKKGFVTTYQVARPIMFIGKYKLDWIFVKPAKLTDPKDRKQSYRFAPHFGRTLTVVSEAVEGRISDHRPIIVDLPLAEPPIK